MAQEEEPRLYSKQPRQPVDVIATQHQAIHADLERWGSWNRDRYEPSTCESLEKLYDHTGGRAPSKAVVSLPTNPRLIAIDRVVRLMGMSAHQHAETLKLYYAQRRQPIVICRAVAIHWKDFSTWMFDCRSLVVNRLRQMGESA